MKSLKIDTDDDYIRSWVYLMLLNFALKMVKIVSLFTAHFIKKLLLNLSIYLKAARVC